MIGTLAILALLATPAAPMKPAILLAAGDPTAVTFAPSSDHNTVLNGAPLVTGYDVVYKKASDGSVVKTQSCGKPTFATTVSCAIATGLPPNTNLTATVNTLWSGPAVPSAASDPFVASVVAPAPAGKPTVQ